MLLLSLDFDLEGAADDSSTGVSAFVEAFVMLKVLLFDRARERLCDFWPASDVVEPCCESDECADLIAAGREE